MTPVRVGSVPEGMTASAPSAGTEKLFSAELFQNEASDHRLQKYTDTLC